MGGSIIIPLILYESPAIDSQYAECQESKYSFPECTHPTVAAWCWQLEDNRAEIWKPCNEIIHYGYVNMYTRLSWSERKPCKTIVQTAHIVYKTYNIRIKHPKHKCNKR